MRLNFWDDTIGMRAERRGFRDGLAAGRKEAEDEIERLHEVEKAALALYKLIAHNSMSSAEDDACDDLVEALAAADAFRKEQT